MKKLIFTLLAAVAFSASFAQSKSTSSGAKLSVGLDFGLPVGNFGNGYSIGFGGNGKAEIPVASAFNFTITAGYTSFYYDKEVKDFFKSIGEPTYQGFVPVKVGGKFFFSPNVYGEAEVGAAIATNNGGGTAFAYAPGLGLSYPVSDKHDIDFGVRYEGWSKDGTNLGQVGFRIAYKFGL
jgi:opacity protein-like surface antigen